MKTNNLLKAIALAIVMTPLYNCSIEAIEELQQETNQLTTTLNAVDVCNAQIPKSRITNNSNQIVDFEIHDANGILVNYVYGLNPGDTSDWKTFPVGMTTFTISTSESVKPVNIDMGTCMAYDVAIDVNNQLNTSSATQL